MGTIKKRALSLLLCAQLLFSQMGVTAYAVGAEPGGLCEHHPAHTAQCGYTEATPGHPCGDVCQVCTVKDSGTREPIDGNDLPAPEKPGPVEGMENTVTRITGFEALVAGVQNRLVPAGTDWDALALPTTLEASGYTVANDAKPLSKALTVEDVTWEIDPDHEQNDGNSTYHPELGSYCLTPVLPNGYELESGVELPEIYVRIDGQATLLSYDENTYSKNDVDVINAMIDANGLSATKDDPVSWTFVTWNGEAPKRTEQLSLDNKGLTGTLDVSSLASLTILSCNDNQLTALNLSGLTGLKTLSCSNNKLSALDVSGLTSLASLNCNTNQLTALDVSSLTGLKALSCSNNKLSALNVSGLSSLKTLSCNNNQLTVLNVTGLTSLTDLTCTFNQLTTLDASSLTSLTYMTCNNNQLTTLNVSGLTSLARLDCTNNKLTALDMSALTNLNYLGCGSNQLTALGVSSSTGLKTLICNINQLTALDVSSLTDLTRLTCNNNQLTTLNMSGLTGLTDLICSNNQLTALDVSALTGLTYLDCMGNRLTALDVSGLSSLTTLTCQNNPLAFFKLAEGRELTVAPATGGTVSLTSYNHSSKSVALTATAENDYTFQSWTASGTTLPSPTDNPVTFTLDANMTLTPVFSSGSADPNDTNNDGYHDGDVAVINAVIENNGLSATKDAPASWTFATWNHETPKRIRLLNIAGKDLTGALDVTGLGSLQQLSCNQNRLTALDASGLSSLTNLDCSDNQLSALNVSGLSSLIYLNCSDNQLTALNMSGLSSLNYLNCSENQLTALDLSGLSSLTSLYCNQNKLTALDMSSLSSLTNLTCSNNQLTALNVSGLSSLTNLTCNQNKLTALNVSGLSDLTNLNCSKNQLTALDVSGLSILTSLNCYENQLTTLDVSSLASLINLDCSDNQLTALDVSGLSSLTSLNCYNNKLTALDVSGLSSLTILGCQNNPLAFFKLAEGRELTVAPVAGGTVNLTAYDHSSNSVILMATAQNDFAFQSWTASGITLPSPTANPVTFTLDAKMTLTPIFSDPNADKVALAKSAIEGGTYTVEQATANTQDTVRTELARQINALLGAGDTGIAVTAGDITINSFTAATAGTADDWDGTDGSFSFTVSLAKGSSTATASKDGSITATRYRAPVITTESLPGGKVGTAYAATLAATGDEPITWSVVSGSLPDGLTLSGATISGTPTIAGSFSFTVQAASGNGLGTEKAFTITISTHGADATLKTLTVTGATIVPTFSPATTSYTATVGNSVSKVIITAEANDGRANVTGDTGERTLKVGENRFTVTVTAENGEHRDYSIAIQREAASSPPPNGGNGSGDYDNGESTSSIPPAPPEPDTPTTETITPGNPDKSGSVSISNEQVTNAVNEAVIAAERGGKAKNGIAVAANLSAATTSVTLERAALDRLIASGVKSFRLNFNGVTLSFDLPALKEMAEKTTGTLTFGVVKATGLTGDALTAIGARPAYNLTVSWQKDGKTVYLDSFGAGSVSVGMAYAPAANERTGSLYAVCANGGRVEWIGKSSYDRNSGAVLFKTNHFSTYGVGYKAPPAFADTVNHWAKADIDFAVSRGLLSGTSETTFAPDGSMTRGMFVTALGRLAGIDPAGYPSSGWFTDVPTTAYYAPYVEWAADTGIANSTGEKTFSPDATVTREQMAAMIQRYAENLGDALPVTRVAESFTDASRISDNLKDAVRQIQQAGIVSGKGQRFGPKDTVTRAEAATALRQLVEIVIDPATAGGWTQNDVGSWLYYQNGKPVTGWKQIEGHWYYFDLSGIMQAGGWRQIGSRWYYFYPTGIMAVNTKVDGYQLGPDGARKDSD